MVFNEYIKCEVCGSVTRIRLQVGWLNEHPIAVTCGKCGISLRGKVFIHQEETKLSFKFENAKTTTIEPPKCCDFVVECSGEFTTIKISKDYGIDASVPTPYIRFYSNTDSDSLKKFVGSIVELKHTLKVWPQYNRLLQLNKDGNWEYLVQEIGRIFPDEFITCRNELEILRAVRMIEVKGFLSPLKPNIISLPEIGTSILKLDKKQIYDLIDYLNFHDGYSLEQIKEQINRLLNEFVEVYPYLIPAFSLQFCKEENIDFETEGTTTSTYQDVKQFYLDVYETLGNLLIIPLALDNIRSRKDINIFKENDNKINSLDEFISSTKANRFHLYNTDEIFMRTLDAKYNQKLRNAIGHNDVEYDNISQTIIYIPNAKNRDKKDKVYLLEFEIEALSMFQSILVISEYLYRLQELELIREGEIPLPVELPVKMKTSGKIYPNDKCPCGSGLKYKKCHGNR